jgi:predicted DNA-binding transcriptional regulator AlpA
MFTSESMLGFVVRQDAPPQGTDTVLVSMADLRAMIREEITRALGAHDGEEKLLDAHEAAKLMCVSTDWLYRHASKLPFTKRLGPKALRFSYQGIMKWLETRNVRH